MTLPLRPAGVPVTLPSSDPGYLADHQVLLYLAVSFTGLLFPQYEARVFNSAFPAMLGEVAIMLWLLIKGAKPQPLGAAASSLAAC